MISKCKLFLSLCLFITPLISYGAPREKSGPGEITDCLIISESGSYTVTRDLPASGGFLTDGSCISIQANAVSIDLNDHSITGLGLGSGVGISDGGIPRQNVKIRNGTVTGFLSGIDLSASSSSSVENIHASDNSQDGIAVGSESKIFENVAVRNGRGFAIQCPSNAIGNSAWGNSQHDFFRLDPENCSLSEGLNSIGTAGDNCAGCEGLGFTECSGNCVDTDSDESNCGGCNNNCEAGFACVSGTCSLDCPVPLLQVANTCVDPQTNRDYCGATPTSYGDICAPGEICESGVCQLSCQSGLTICSNTCTNLETDLANCGACGAACDTGQICVNAMCTAY